MTLSTSDALLHYDTFTHTGDHKYGCHPLHHTHAQMYEEVPAHVTCEHCK